MQAHQNAFVYVTLLGTGQEVTHALPPGRRAWVQVTRGHLTLNGATLSAGDGVAMTDERARSLAAAAALIFDLS